MQIWSLERNNIEYTATISSNYIFSTIDEKLYIFIIFSTILVISLTKVFPKHKSFALILSPSNLMR